jgi:hypothetical protein
LINWNDLKRVKERQAVDQQTLSGEIAAAHQPVVMRGLVRDWPLVSAASGSIEDTANYLFPHCDDKPVNTFIGESAMKGRFFYGDDLKSFNFERVQISVRQLFERLGDQATLENPQHIFAGAIPVPERAKSLVDENRNPLLGQETEQLISLWIGNQSRTAAHWDLAQNIACVVRGPRRFTLFPTEQVKNLYIGPLDFTLSGQAISLVDFHAPDFERFPRFKLALQHAQVAELEPGDAIYIPSLWFHHVESFDPLSILMNYWWRDAPEFMVTPLLTMLHSLLTIRDLPAAERQAWKTLFDHYIFQTDGDPMMHIPQDARGVFGELTPEKVQGLRNHLGKQLLR